MTDLHTNGTDRCCRGSEVGKGALTGRAGLFPSTHILRKANLPPFQISAGTPRRTFSALGKSVVLILLVGANLPSWSLGPEIPTSFIRLLCPWNFPGKNTGVPPSLGFSRQEYWSRLQCPLPGDLPDPESSPCLLHLLHGQVGSLPLSHLVNQFIMPSTM